MGELDIKDQKLVCFRCKRKVETIKINKHTGYRAYCIPCYEKTREVNEVYIVLCRDWLTVEPEVFRTEQEAKDFIKSINEKIPDYYKESDFIIFRRDLDRE